MSRQGIIFSLALVLNFLVGVSCGGGGSTPSSSSSTSFPDDLAVASPTDANATSSAISNMLNASTSDAGPFFATAYEVEKDKVSDILNATTLATCGPNIQNLLRKPASADCYGPEIAYVDHPDASGGEPNDGTLPIGDTGIWSVTETGTDEACAAAQLNTRIEAVKEKVSGALLILASMICTVNNTAGLSLPTDGSSITITSELNAMLAAANQSSTATVTTGTISAASNSVGTTDYTYSLSVTLSLPEFGNPTNTIQTAMVVNMTHRPLVADNSTYRGKVNFRMNNDDAQGNCSNSQEFGDLTTTNITEAGSVTYELASATSLRIDSRYAQGCGDDNIGMFDSNGILDPTLKATRDSQGTPENEADLSGWAGNFSRLMVDGNPVTGVGNYVFMWQAGLGDGTARTFNLTMGDADSDGIADASAFFGYGDDIATADGDILGIYCNWAGPRGGVGNQDLTKRQTLTQRQVIEFNATSGLFEASSSSITYAPVLDCSLSASDLTTNGAFQYDIDADGDADIAAVLTHNLVDPTTAIPDSGFTTPTAPTGL